VKSRISVVPRDTSWHIAAKLEVHAGIFDVTNSVEAKAGLTLPKEYGTDKYTWVPLHRSTGSYGDIVSTVLTGCI
jgi:hypothetical protein